ncbi:YciI family protein [Oceanobacillus iheyensis]|uniref:YCII-related domain-containing protein n=1 Tax=Oceanobacillus iheyensis (strain DSM 14371 / CIP 107618 / JCM 11309 / KCTC 3954 / HTE831) TaxID=221109 RepID=Q8EN80_OCEIH|nr:YciI family protein [Oceanobacillus iheyensis]BAC14563.1 hypothetical protein [Oceanobacillus iheyensis HTE831]
MKYFMVLLPMLDEEKSKQYRQDHLDYIAKKDEEGHVFAKGRFVDGFGGMVIYIAEDLAHAESIAKEDPYVVKEARTYEIHEWEMTTRAVLPE